MGTGEINYSIQVSNLLKVYDDGTPAVDHNTFCVKKGEIFGLLGPNGAGKSSMFNIMSMNVKRTDGDVKILGAHIDQIDVKSHA